ncbi:MAG: hypothetical protein CVT67_02315 [Actinobacteria bacterium HGW-Actinobacteria-7]|nr:MAG: hypothetical protein CVT67_02315 [Actinobacteria bacterium HGW-Actinobacteria-7]
MSGKAKILLGVAVVFAVVLGMKLGGAAIKPTAVAPAANSVSTPAEPSLTPTAARGDASAEYDAALRAGKPVYVLFHSTTCQSCIDISRVVDGVLPEYADRLTFVNAITDDPGARSLADRFEFQYIPTSFFIDGKGKIVDSYVGPLDEPGLRTYLDSLTAR